MQGARAIEMDEDMTLDEVKASLLTRSIELHQVPVHVPLSKRFGVKQGSKVRCVDDFSVWHQ